MAASSRHVAKKQKQQGEKKQKQQGDKKQKQQGKKRTSGRHKPESTMKSGKHKPRSDEQSKHKSGKHHSRTDLTQFLKRCSFRESCKQQIRDHFFESDPPTFLPDGRYVIESRSNGRYMTYLKFLVSFD